MPDRAARAVLTRRRLAAGAAWAVPTALLAGAAPAVAASCEQCADPDGVLVDTTSSGTTTLTLEACTRRVAVEVAGAAGGVSGNFGGSGSRIRGVLTLPAGGTTLTLVVGRQGAGRGAAYPGTDWGSGYGNGGRGGQRGASYDGAGGAAAPRS